MGAPDLLQDEGDTGFDVMLALLRMAGLSAVGLLAAAPVQAAVVICRQPGVPAGCTAAGPVNPVVGPRGPVVNPSPGVGYGAPGVGVRPAAGPGAGPNAGGPVNRAGWR